MLFMEESVCGKIDVYFCGHDHNRQWFQPTCGTEFVVSGAAAKNTDLEGRYADLLRGRFAARILLVEIEAPFAW